MKRTIAALLLVFMSLLQVSTAAAHGLTPIAAISLHGDEVTIRLIDTYGAAIEQAEVSVRVGEPEGKPGAPVRLPEVRPGVYEGQVELLDGISTLTVEAVIFDELYREAIRVEKGEELPETLLPLAGIDSRLDHFNWGVMLYVAAGIVLVAATAVAVVRTRKSGGGEEA